MYSVYSVVRKGFVLNPDMHQIFSGQGPLAEAIPGYKLRPQQIDMAQAILEAIKHQDKLVV